MRKASAFIEKITKDRMVETGVEFLDVAVKVVYLNDEAGEPLSEPEVIETRKFGIDPSATKSQIVDEIKRFIDQYNLDAVMREANKEKDAQNQATTQLIEELTGGVIK